MNEWLKLRSLQRSNVGRGSLCDIIAVPIEDVSFFPAIDPTLQRLTSAILLRTAKTWLSFSAMSTFGRALKEEPQVGPAGLYYKQTVNGTIHSQNAHNHIQLNNMPLHRWIVLCRERGTGLTYILGKPTAGCTITISYVSDKGTKTTVTFETNSKHRAFLYGGADFSEPSTPPPPEIFLITMIAEFRIGEPDRPPAGAMSMIVPELGHRPNIAIFVDGGLISQKGLNDRQSCTYDPLENEIHLTRPVAFNSLIQIYEIHGE